MINASASGHQVWIAGGTYKPSTSGLSNPREASFSLKNGVSVLGGFSGVSGTEGNVNARTAMPSSTTLSGDIGTPNDNSDNTYHVFYNGNGLDNSTILDGATITAGNANVNLGPTSPGNGGGMYNYSSPTILNCLFVANYALQGGGVSNNNGNARMINCIFRNNIASTSGGGARDQASSLYVNCFFSQNAASGSSTVGGGIFTSGTTRLVNCTFSDNTASYGGAVSHYFGARHWSTAYYGIMVEGMLFMLILGSQLPPSVIV